MLAELLFAVDVGFLNQVFNRFTDGFAGFAAENVFEKIGLWVIGVLSYSS